MAAGPILLTRLEHVRQSGPGRWVARCPAHGDRAPSLSIRGLEDGRILIHDFAGCSPTDILAAIGLGLRDLYPERLSHHLAPTRDCRHFHSIQAAMRSMSDDVLLIAVAAENVVAGIELTDEDRVAVADAAARLRDARRIAA